MTLTHPPPHVPILSYSMMANLDAAEESALSLPNKEDVITLSVIQQQEKKAQHENPWGGEGGFHKEILPCYLCFFTKGNWSAQAALHLLHAQKNSWSTGKMAQS